jgi:hypothetical protein
VTIPDVGSGVGVGVAAGAAVGVATCVGDAAGAVLGNGLGVRVGDGVGVADGIGATTAAIAGVAGAEVTSGRTVGGAGEKLGATGVDPHPANVMTTTQNKAPTNPGNRIVSIPLLWYPSTKYDVEIGVCVCGLFGRVSSERPNEPIND